jgi:metal-responsive CopG/Arc/MetJ family transcriptional regulator
MNARALIPPGWYNGGMKRKTSVSLSDDLLRLLARASGKGESRSEAIERLVREGLLARARRVADEKDLAVLNRYALTLNREAKDVLEYQADV